MAVEFLADLGQLVGAVAACVTLIFVVKATQHSGQAVRDAQRMLELEGERDERAIAVEERRQASKIALWPVEGDLSVGRPWGVELVNASEGPVFDFVLERPRGLTGKNKEVPSMTASAQIVPPGRYFVGGDARWPSLLTDDVVLVPVTGNSVYMPSVTFTDSDGRKWSRGVDGHLERKS
ncbi:hypothetical protein ACIPY2_08840 [Paenarthrobacter sp. NPDC089675]|uniref:hypothetical protein n=1 Tax=Paenarthrobacter sp. NPDC089675 TaxID=3364376 RepID=UPI00380BC5D5